MIRIAVLLSISSTVHAAPCETSDRWIVTQGELAPGQACGSWIGSTNANTVAYSIGQFTLATEVTLPYRITVTWRRLGADARALELHLLGAALLLGEQRIGLWIDDASFETDGFHPLPKHSTRDEHEVSVIQRATGIEVSVDGRAVDRWTFRTTISRGKPAIAFKGGRGTRAQMRFSNVRVDQLEQARPK